MLRRLSCYSTSVAYLYKNFFRFKHSSHGRVLFIKMSQSQYEGYIATVINMP